MFIARFVIILCLLVFSSFYQSLAEIVEVDGKSAQVITVDPDTLNTIRLSEKSGFSDSYCVVVGMMQGPVSKVMVSLVLVMTGIGGYIGRLQLGTVVAIAVGTLIIFTGTSVIDILLPRFGLSTGCKCKTYVLYGRGDMDPNTGRYLYNAVKTGLNPDCSNVK